MQPNDHDTNDCDSDKAAPGRRSSRTLRRGPVLQRGRVVGDRPSTKRKEPPKSPPSAPAEPARAFCRHTNEEQHVCLPGPSTQIACPGMLMSPEMQRLEQLQLWESLEEARRGGDGRECIRRRRAAGAPRMVPMSSVLERPVCVHGAPPPLPPPEELERMDVDADLDEADRRTALPPLVLPSEPPPAESRRSPANSRGASRLCPFMMPPSELPPAEGGIPSELPPAESRRTLPQQPLQQPCRSVQRVFAARAALPPVLGWEVGRARGIDNEQQDRVPKDDESSEGIADDEIVCQNNPCFFSSVIQVPGRAVPATVSLSGNSGDASGTTSAFDACRKHICIHQLVANARLLEDPAPLKQACETTKACIFPVADDLFCLARNLHRSPHGSVTRRQMKKMRRRLSKVGNESRGAALVLMDPRRSRHADDGDVKVFHMGSPEVDALLACRINKQRILEHVIAVGTRSKRRNCHGKACRLTQSWSQKQGDHCVGTCCCGQTEQEDDDDTDDTKLPHISFGRHRDVSGRHSLMPDNVKRDIGKNLSTAQALLDEQCAASVPPPYSDTLRSQVFGSFFCRHFKGDTVGRFEFLDVFAETGSTLNRHVDSRNDWRPGHEACASHSYLAQCRGKTCRVNFLMASRCHCGSATEQLKKAGIDPHGGDDLKFCRRGNGHEV